MMGVVYTTFMDMVEDKFSDEVLDEILETPNLSTGGAFTSVGYYGHTDMIKLVVRLSELTNLPVDTLIEAFGEHLFGVLISKYPMLAEGRNTSLELLEVVDTAIHVEVLKLYPDAELPEFRCERIDSVTLHMEYRSKRPFSRLALGLIKGCAKHFGEELAITHESFDSNEQFETHFNISRVA
ncbi:heme NO-binding domain-containing protein [Marinomonas ostreistagni]|uniref:Heme NO-binding domain-containing protein n=1 Tax=Marinomonas ostreistagni TaxID=359209 RepID=A0ABS0ZFS1_9GAMM|nr:heme NO-binding domain-containing protein [Marinomonas ostreistagni]MBJ7552258.1 heme NO-binding domain-containing protein [Marinomonas ostreistagni]